MKRFLGWAQDQITCSWRPNLTMSQDGIRFTDDSTNCKTKVENHVYEVGVTISLHRVCAKVSAGAHRPRRSSWLNSVAEVESVAVDVVCGQQLCLLVPWMNSPYFGVPPGAAAPPLVL
jgi:hypothetical protein